MDTAVVYSQSEKPSSQEKLVWTEKVSFAHVPRRLVELWDGVSYEEWMVWASMFDRNPNYWALGWVNPQGLIRAFIYGWWEPMDREMRVTRVVIDPKLQMDKVEGAPAEMLGAVRFLASEKGVRRIYFETIQWKMFMRRFKGMVRIFNDCRVLEVAQW